MCCAVAARPSFPCGLVPVFDRKAVISQKPHSVPACEGTSELGSSPARPPGPGLSLPHTPSHLLRSSVQPDRLSSERAGDPPRSLYTGVIFNLGSQHITEFPLPSAQEALLGCASCEHEAPGWLRTAAWRLRDSEGGKKNKNLAPFQTLSFAAPASSTQLKRQSATN